MEFIEAAKPEIRLIAELLISPSWKHPRLESICEDRLHEWNSKLKGRCKFVRQRQHIENAETAAHQTLPAARIPGKANTRLEVSQGWVCEKGRSYVRHHVDEVPQVRDAVLRLGRNRRHFIAQAEIHGEIFLQANVILCIGA